MKKEIEVKIKKWMIKAVRPTGEIETINNKFCGYKIADKIWSQMVTAIRNAGRGEIEQIEIEEIIKIEEEVSCKRCGEKKEGKYFKNKEEYYCADCKTLLQAVGAGELSAWEQLEQDVDNTPATKTDY